MDNNKNNKHNNNNINTISHLSISLQAIITLASRLAKSRAISLPIPVFAPVTITTLSFNLSVLSYKFPLR